MQRFAAFKIEMHGHLQAPPLAPEPNRQIGRSILETYIGYRMGPITKVHIHVYIQYHDPPVVQIATLQPRQPKLKAEGQQALWDL